MTNPCDTLFEDLLRLIDKPYEYNQLIAKILCELLRKDAAQNIALIDGVPYFFDSVRNKTLSLSRATPQYTAYGLGVTNRYLSLGVVPSQGPQGFLVPRNATITGLWAKSRTTAPWTVEVRKNGANLTLASINIVASEGSDTNVDIDVNAGDTLQMFANGVNIGFPIATVELAWRTL